MITERQIKSRFRKSHLLKLANEFLNKDLELKDKVAKWFVLCPGYSVEDLVESISFEGIELKKDKVDDFGRYWHTVNLKFVIKQKNYRGELVSCAKKEEFGCDDHWAVEYRGKAIGNWNDYFKSLPFERQIDEIIMWDLFRYCDHIIKDNSVIPIYF